MHPAMARTSYRFPGLRVIVIGGTMAKDLGAVKARQQLAWVLFLDAVRHRGQLSTHLRPMGGSVPSIDGPSADTPRG